jgi:hypothetical protein
MLWLALLPLATAQTADVSAVSAVGDALKTLNSMLEGMATMTMTGTNTIPPQPMRPATLEFDLHLTPKSPLVWFNEARDEPNANTTARDWTPVMGARSTAVDLSNHGGWVDGSVRYRLTPDTSQLSQMYVPVVGSGVRFEGILDAAYDGWLLFYQGTGKQYIVQPSAQGVIADDMAQGIVFTRRSAQLVRNYNTGDKGNVEITGVTVRTGMNSSA